MNQEKDLNLSRDLTSYYKLIVHGKIENISLKTAVKFRELLKQLSSEYKISFECLSYSVLDSKGIGYKVINYRIEHKDVSEIESEDIPEIESEDIPEIESEDISVTRVPLAESSHLEIYQTMCEVEQKIDKFLDEEGEKRQYFNSRAIKLIAVLQNPFYAVPIMLILTTLIVLFVYKK